METQTKRAEVVARRAHGDAVDLQGAPYILHVERVAGAVSSDTAKAMAWLHDTLEDTGETPATLLAAGVSERVLRGVQLLTRGGETYPAYTARLAVSGDPLAIYVKLADLRDNLRPGGRVSLHARYLLAIDQLERAPWGPDICEACGQRHWSFVGCFRPGVGG